MAIHTPYSQRMNAAYATTTRMRLLLRATWAKTCELDLTASPFLGSLLSGPGRDACIAGRGAPPSSPALPGCHRPAQRHADVRDRAELAPVLVGLLQVVAHDVVVLVHPICDGGLQPHREARVQLSPPTLRQRVVRRLSDQRVPEPVQLVVPGRRDLTDQVLAHQSLQDTINASAQRFVDQCCHRLSVKDLAHDRGRPEYAALVVLEQVQPSGQKGADRWRRVEAIETAGKP